MKLLLRSTILLGCIAIGLLVAWQVVQRSNPAAPQQRRISWAPIYISGESATPDAKDSSTEPPHAQSTHRARDNKTTPRTRPKVATSSTVRLDLARRRRDLELPDQTPFPDDFEETWQPHHPAVGQLSLSNLLGGGTDSSATSQTNSAQQQQQAAGGGSLLDLLANPQVQQMLNPQNIGKALETLQNLQNRPNPAAAAATPADATPPAEPPKFEPLASGAAQSPDSKVSDLKQNIVRSHPEDEGDHRLTITIQDEDLRSVLELLSQQGNLNLLAGPSVQGRVTASLTDVDVDSAIAAILRSTGFQMRRDGNFLYVGSGEEFAAQDRVSDRVRVRVYRPNYIPAGELSGLIEPLLSEQGKSSVTKAPEVGISKDDSGAGGNNFGGEDAVVVQDLESVLRELDQLVAEVDTRPPQVAIEAMILSVKLKDDNQFGVNWQFLRDREHVRFGIGSPRTAPLEGTGNVDGATGGIVGDFRFEDGGLRFAFLDSSLGHFIDALETIGETNVIASPRLMCLNKQRAEILIGAQLGYISTTVTETSSTQNVQFLDVGTQLRLRPFVYSDGSIRLEVHPELSTGVVRTVGGFTLPEKEVTQVTTNVMTRDSMTVIIGGLIREDLKTDLTQIPVLGSIPYAGWLFRQKTDTVERTEILVLVTPHVVCDAESAREGDDAAQQFHRRQGVVKESMTILNKRSIGRRYLRRAHDAWAAGNAQQADRLLRWAIHFDPENRDAIELRADVLNGIHDPKHHEGPLVPPQQQPGCPPGGELPEWMIDELDHEGAHAPAQMTIIDPALPEPTLEPEHTPHPEPTQTPMELP
jgi:type IV pilus assembly protein PilQ